MEKPAEIKNGVLEGLSRILREILATPKYKETFHILLNNLDPQNAGLIVQALTSEDPEIFLGLMSASPKLANTFIYACHELVAHLEKMPIPLMEQFLANTLDEIDSEKAGETFARAFLLFLKTKAEPADDCESDFGRGFANVFSKTANMQILHDAVLNGISAWMTKVGRNADDPNSNTTMLITNISTSIKLNPEFVKNAVTPIVKAIKEVSDE